MPRPIRGSFWVSRHGREGTGPAGLPPPAGGPPQCPRSRPVEAALPGARARWGKDAGFCGWAGAAAGGRGSDCVLSLSPAYAVSLDTAVEATRAPLPELGLDDSPRTGRSGPCGATSQDSTCRKPRMGAAAPLLRRTVRGTLCLGLALSVDLPLGGRSLPMGMGHPCAGSPPEATSHQPRRPLGPDSGTHVAVTVASRALAAPMGEMPTEGGWDPLGRMVELEGEARAVQPRCPGEPPRVQALLLHVARRTRSSFQSPAPEYSFSLDIPLRLQPFSAYVVSQREGKVCWNPDPRPESVWLLDPTERAGPSSWLEVINSVVGPLLPHVVPVLRRAAGPVPHASCGSGPLLQGDELEEPRHVTVWNLFLGPLASAAGPRSEK